MRALSGRRRSAGRARAFALCVAALVTAHAGAAAQVGSWRVASGQVVVVCPLTVGGSFDATSRSVSGQLSVDASQPSKLAGTIEVDLETLDTGISLRNAHMRDNYLEVGRGDGFKRAVLSDIVLNGDAATATGAMTFTGTLLVHGVRKPVSGEARIARSGGAVRVDARFLVTLPDFGIAKPRYLGVGVKDQVQVKVSFGSAQ